MPDTTVSKRIAEQIREIRSLIDDAISGNGASGRSLADDMALVGQRLARIEAQTQSLEDSYGEMAALVSKYRTVADTDYDWEYWISPDETILYISPSCERITGYTREDFIDRPGLIDEIVHPDDRQAICHDAEFTNSADHNMSEFRIITRAGEERWIQRNSDPVYGDGREFHGRRMNNRDITARKLLERELTQSEERFRLSFENANVGACMVDLQGNLLKVNKKMSEMFGYSREELEAMTVNTLAHPGDTSLSPDVIKAALNGSGPEFEFEKRYIDARGNVIIAKVSTSLARDSNKNPLYFITHLLDVTETRLAEEKLRKSEEMFRMLVDSSPLVIIVKVKSAGNVRYFNRTFTELLGYTADDLSDVDDWRSLAHPDAEEREQLKAEWNRRVMAVTGSNKASEPMETEVTCKDGSKKIMEWRFVSFGDYGVSFGIDLTDKKMAEEALRASEELFRTAIQASPDGFVITDLETRILMVSPSVLKMGRREREEDVVGHFGMEFYLSEDWPDCMEHVQQLMGGENPGPKEYRVLRADGTLLDIETNGMLIHDSHGAPKGMLFVMRDISERKLLDAQRLEMERKLSEAQKLESLAVMAGGIAHDFNNILMGVMGNLELALDNRYLDDLTRRRIQAALSGAERSAELSGKMLLYSGNAIYLPKDMNLADVVMGNESTIRQAISKNTNLVINAPDSLPSIRGEREQLTRMIANVVTNASEALGDEPGDVTITLGVMKCDEKFLTHSRIEEKPAPGEFVFIEFKDTGCGMDAETLGKIFDPFFSTRFLGRGMGMPEALGIVKGHGGAIMVDSAVGEGSRVRVFFRVNAGAGHTATGKPQQKPQTAETASNEKVISTILVVDDEELVRGMVAERLKILGYSVIPANDGKQAVDIYRDRSTEIDLVMLDFMMPVMNGVEAFNELLAINPDVKVILCTGYSEDAVAKMFNYKRPAGILLKPYKLHDMKHELERLLSEKSL